MAETVVWPLSTEETLEIQVATRWCQYLSDGTKATLESYYEAKNQLDALRSTRR